MASAVNSFCIRTAIFVLVRKVTADKVLEGPKGETKVGVHSGTLPSSAFPVIRDIPAVATLTANDSLGDLYHL
jgi:uncharacterized membrane protein